MFRSSFATSQASWRGIPWQALAAEFIGTMFFLFAALLSVAANYPSGSYNTGSSSGVTSDRGTTALVAAVSYGSSYAVILFCLGRASGGHFNPAITLACIWTKKITVLKGFGYMFSQFIGGIMAALLVQTCIPSSAEARDASLLGAGSLGPGVAAWQGLLTELLLTFLLTFVYFGAVVDYNGLGKLSPLAMGLAVATGSLAAFPLSGGSLNPARSLGAAIVVNDIEFWKVLYIYLIGPFVGCTFAAALYEFLFTSRDVPLPQYDDIN
eukprot:TRINITY_DN13110_c0_g1_i1.p1 TRINITY_DN13110_c0_g1~~TRINITY_DN13110_c0_g1_i1.p1  ORF type:complete len:267 (-),score=36.59 TRINITY_DN13110_c0_g1_i1:105-905(-)